MNRWIVFGVLALLLAVCIVRSDTALADERRDYLGYRNVVHYDKWKNVEHRPNRGECRISNVWLRSNNPKTNSSYDRDWLIVRNVSECRYRTPTSVAVRHTDGRRQIIDMGGRRTFVIAV